MIVEKSIKFIFLSSPLLQPVKDAYFDTIHCHKNRPDGTLF
jgi:hypothetical protein